MNTSPPPGRGQTRPRWVSLLQGLVIVAAMAFLVHAVGRSLGQLKVLLDSPNWWLFSGILAVAGIAMVWIGLVWTVIVVRLGGSLPMIRGICLYFVGEMTKYLPGSLWPVLGRSELAVREASIKRPEAYTSVALSLILNYVLAAAVASMLLVPFALFGEHGSLTVLWLLLVIPIGALALHPRVLAVAVRWTEVLVRQPLRLPVLPWRDTIQLVGLYLPAWGAVAVANVLAADLLGSGLPFGTVAFASTLAWLAGFLVVPAPSGLGVREGVFAAVLGPGVPTETAFAIAIVARVAFVLADAGGAMAGLLFMWVRRRGTSGDESGSVC